MVTPRTVSGFLWSIFQGPLLPIALISVTLAACDPNDKVVRASPKKPVDVEKAQSEGGDSGEDGSDQGLSGGSTGGFGGGRNGFGGSDDNTSDDIFGDDSASSETPAESDDSDTSVSGGSDSNTSDDLSSGDDQSGEGVKSPGLRAGGPSDCAADNAGACFKEARPLILTSPKEAIELYSTACVTDDTGSGDGLACRAAGLLARASGDPSGAQSYFDAACRKTKDPVTSACPK